MSYSKLIIMIGAANVTKRNRENHYKAFKEKVTLEAINDQLTLSERADCFRVHSVESQINGRFIVIIWDNLAIFPIALNACEVGPMRRHNYKYLKSTHHFSKQPNAD